MSYTKTTTLPRTKLSSTFCGFGADDHHNRADE
jgi:hypothetical protein